jgi:hypothetical protein
MIELLAAMTIMVVGLIAVFALFQTGIVTLRRASTITTAAAIADAEMERFRAVKYSTLGLDSDHTCPSGCSAADAVYRAHAAYRADTAVTTTLSGNVTAAATSLGVSGATGFPASAEFRVKIGSELLLVSAVSGLTWTVKRGQDGTVPAAYSTGATVTLKERVDVAGCSDPGPPSPCTTLLPTKPATGADGRDYRVDTYVTWSTVTNDAGAPGRAVKQITVAVRDLAAPNRTWATVTSIFDESTGL